MRQAMTKSDRTSSGSKLRLQVYLARCGLGSRRSCEKLIEAGRVKVNGARAELGQSVDPANDDVALDGKAVEPLRREWIALHKPRGYVSTRDDPRDRKTVYDLIPAELSHLFHVGRLDRDSSGLLLLTNDGKVANRLLHPRYGTAKVYRVDVEGYPDDDTLRKLVEGVKLEDGPANAQVVEYEGPVGKGRHRVWLTLQEGRNREVRRLMEAVGHPVHRLFRSTFGPIELGNLGSGRWRRLSEAEIASLSE